MNFNKNKNNNKTKTKCIGPCYKPNTFILHPTELIYISADKPFCPIKPNVHQLDDEKTYTKYVEKCDINQVNNLISTVYPFNYKEFLENFYNILSYDDFIKYINENKNNNIVTHIRIIECAINVFKQNFIDEDIVNSYIKYITNYRINEIYGKLYNIIDFNKKIKIKKNDLDKNKYRQERIEYIVEKFITNSYISKILLKLNKNKKEFITNNFITYLTKQIKKDLLEEL